MVTQTAHAAGLTVTIDGEPLTGGSFAKDGATYVALAPFLQAIGDWETVWDYNTRTASAETDLFSLCVPAQQQHVLADGFPFDLSAASLVHNGSTYVPLRSFANLLGAQVEFVDWDSPVVVSSPQNISYTDNDFYWLSRIISAESKGESLLGQIAVGNVILNRVASSQFPNSISDVIFDKKDAVQFEPVANGTIYEDPAPQSILAARLVLNGTSVVENSLYFFNPAYSSGSWIRQNRTYFSTIGCHQFYI